MLCNALRTYDTTCEIAWMKWEKGLTAPMGWARDAAASIRCGIDFQSTLQWRLIRRICFMWKDSVCCVALQTIIGKSCGVFYWRVVRRNRNAKSFFQIEEILFLILFDWISKIILSIIFNLCQTLWTKPELELPFSSLLFFAAKKGFESRLNHWVNAIASNESLVGFFLRYATRGQ